MTALDPKDRAQGGVETQTGEGTSVLILTVGERVSVLRLLDPEGYLSDFKARAFELLSHLIWESCNYRIS